LIGKAESFSAFLRILKRNAAGKMPRRYGAPPQAFLSENHLLVIFRHKKKFCSPKGKQNFFFLLFFRILAEHFYMFFQIRAEDFLSKRQTENCGGICGRMSVSEARNSGFVISKRRFLENIGCSRKSPC